jgi:hypothetical protein
VTPFEQGKRLVPTIALYSVPMLFCLAVHWLAMRTWFSADDFAWLGLPLELHANLSSWLDVLFGPRAQGTVRTISERVYFLVFTSIFGLNAIPFRIWVFLTQFANIALLIGITRRLTASYLAALLAPILWCANAGLAVSLGWSSAYNEICCAFFLLAAFYCLIHKRWILQWVFFLLGFGALELIVTYPAIAALYTWLYDRQSFRRTLWLFIPSAIFTAVHFYFVPKTPDPSYRMYFDASIPVTLWRYWCFGVAAGRPEVLDWRPIWLGIALAILIAIGFVFLFRKNARLTGFCLAWFVLILLPVLPLKNHVTEYYLTMPAISLAILGAWAVASFPRFAAALAVLYMVVSICDLRIADRYFYERARRMKKLVLGLEANRPDYKGKVVLLSGVDNDLFWSGFYDDPFRLLGIRQIYLTPGSDKAIDPHPEWGGIGKYVLSLDAVMDALADKAVVFAVEQEGVEDITNSYRIIAAAEYAAEHKDFIDVGQSMYEGRLGSGWYPIESGFRWMGKSAKVTMAGPQSASQRVLISGYCPEAVVQKGSLELSVSVNGEKVGSKVFRAPGEKFALDLPVPAKAVGQPSVTVTVEVDHTMTVPSDIRPLGLIFGTFRIK